MKSRELIELFEQNQKAQSGNYFTDGESLFLFGNKIAEHREDGIYFTLAGWNSSTTKQALNHLSGVSIHSKYDEIKNFDALINSNEWYKVRDN